MLCRIFALLIFGGTVTFYFSNIDSFVPLDGEVKSEISKIDAINLLIETESNASEANMSALLKINRDFRKEAELFSEKSESMEEELNFMNPKIKKLQEALDIAKNDFGKEEKKLIEINSKFALEDEKVKSLNLLREEHLNILNQVKAENSMVTDEWRSLDQNFTSLNRVRNAAYDSYLSTTGLLLDRIVLPYEIFFGVMAEAEVESVAPNGSGFFIKLGLDHGMKTDLFFVIRSDEKWSEMPVFVKCTLAENAYSFLEFINLDENLKPSYIQSGKKLTLIRTGDLSYSSNDDEILTSSNLPLHNP